MKQVILIIFIILTAQIAFSANNCFSDSEGNATQCELKVYPNPCRNNVVTVSYSSEDIIEVTLSNIAGQKVLTKKYEFPVQKVKIQLNDMPNGIYLVQTKTSENKYIVKKLIVSKE